jgi:hypothetical protein
MPLQLRRRRKLAAQQVNKDRTVCKLRQRTPAALLFKFIGQAGPRGHHDQSTTQRLAWFV